LKRKIAAIVAAVVAGYSRLVAEDEEETLRRLATYRGVFNDLVARFGGRIFNTAGDAVLAEFQSAVDAVRCAVDLQESLRARNAANALEDAEKAVQLLPEKSSIPGIRARRSTLPSVIVRPPFATIAKRLRSTLATKGARRRCGDWASRTEL
jgi:hypothetical protein